MENVQIMKKIIGIRCTEYNDQTKRIYKIIHSIFPDYPIYFMVDNTSGNNTSIFPSELNVEYMTTDELDKLSLYHNDPKIGWVAGDYSYYMALKYSWDYMWLIEPDVYISSDVYDIVREIDSSDAELIGAYYGERDSNWFWTNKLRLSTNFNRVFWVFFPFTRLSRSLVENALKVRQEISDTVLENKIKLPNDESVIGTVANWKQVSTMALKNSYPREMEHFNLRVRYNYDDIKNQSGIFHPVDSEEKFDEEIIKQLRHELGESPVKDSLKFSSEETILRIFRKLLA